MEHISDEIFLHFQRINDYNSSWKKGEIIEFNKLKENFYFSSLKKSINEFQNNINRNFANELVDLESFIFSKNQEKIEDIACIDEIQKKIYSTETQIKVINEYYKSITKLNQEIVFENVRKKINPELPSRFHCIWVVKELEELCSWIKILKPLPLRYRILKLKLTGNIHLTSGKLIDNEENKNIEKATENSIGYWNMKSYPTEEQEYLFEGKFEIIDEI